jgi:hypothetical protein
MSSPTASRPNPSSEDLKMEDQDRNLIIGEARRSALAFATYALRQAQESHPDLYEKSVLLVRQGGTLFVEMLIDGSSPRLNVGVRDTDGSRMCIASVELQPAETGTVQ